MSLPAAIGLTGSMGDSSLPHAAPTVIAPRLGRDRPDDVEQAFGDLLAPRHTRLKAHCDRMLGSGPDAEDALQDTLVRAWRGLRRFDGRSSLETWLHRIATNVCLDHIAGRARQIGAVDATSAPRRSPVSRLGGEHAPAWLDWASDNALGVDTAPISPEDGYELRETVEACLAVALDLPCRQRVVLILREVLGYSAREVAVRMSTTPTAINSLLQRAHASLEACPVDRHRRPLDHPQRTRIEALVSALEDGDVDRLVALLTAPLAAETTTSDHDWRPAPDARSRSSLDGVVYAIERAKFT